MGKRFQHEHLFQRRTLDLYLKFSVLSSALIASMVVILDHYSGDSAMSWASLLLKFPMTLAFLALNGTVLIETRPYRDSSPIDHTWGAFFLVQFFMVLGLGIEHQRIEFFYLATMPIMAFLFALQSDWFSPTQVKKKRATLVMGIALFSLSGVLYHPEFRGQWPEAAIILMTFGLWQWGTIFLANVEWIRLSRQTLRARLRGNDSGRSSRKSSDIHPLTSERYFFHDLVNHTHGVQLLLSSRIRKNCGLEPHEVGAISQEIGALQQLIHEHFGLGHKNLGPKASWRPFKECIEGCHNIVRAFLDSEEVEVFYQFKGTVSEYDIKNPINQNIELPFVVFHRILTNLVKNCAESHSKRVEFTFTGDHEGLHLTLKNEVYKKRERGYELGKTLESLISEESDKEDGLKGLGLESIESLALGAGGSFHFYIHDGHWTSEVFLPFKEPLTQNDPNLLKSGDKKAA